MSQHVMFLLLGLGNGAVFAALALGLVLTYRSSGVVNFATGAIAVYAAYTYAGLRAGELLIPVPGLPRAVDVGGDVGFPAALAAGLGLSGALGTVLYLVVFRPLRTASPIAKAVASLGVMVMLQSLFAHRFGADSIAVDAILPDRTYQFWDVAISGDRIWFAVVIAAVAGGLSLTLRWSRFGLATRAAAETEKGALVTGLSPDRIALANWVLSAVVAGLGGILIAPIVPLVPSSYTLFIVPALAAALVANFQALAAAVTAALMLGMVQSELTFLQTQHTWLPQHGLPEAVPLVLILGFLVVRGRPLPQRGALIVQALGRAPKPRHIPASAAIAGALGLAGLLATSGSYRAALITSIILAVVALSLVVVTGLAGQVSLAQLALAGSGAFILSRLTGGASIPFPVAPLLAALGATVIGVVVGLPALRIRGLPVAVVTLALAVGIESLWFRNPDFTGGVQGASVESPSLFGMDLGVGGGESYPRVAFGATCLVVLLMVAVGVARLRTSRLGAAMLAVRANERAAAAAGINVARTKMAAFAIAAFIAGLGGSLLAYQQALASPDVYHAFAGFGLFATAYVAGITSITGAILAGVLAAGGISYLFLSRVAEPVGGLYEVITGGLLVFQVIKNPEGLAGGIHRLADRFHRWRTTAPAPGPAPSPMAPAGLQAEADREAAPDGPGTLVLNGVGVRYGGVVALKDVSFTVPPGRIVGLIGPNGAGKTTLLDAISGFTACEGSVEFDGGPLDGLKPHQRTRRGLGRTFQGLELWEELSVEENVVAGLAGHRLSAGDAHPFADLDRLLALLTLDGVRHRAARELSQGQRQLVSIARTLAGRPRFVLLDEPAGGLDGGESDWLAERLRQVRDAGVTILMIDHDMDLVLSVCDEVHVLDLGELIASGPPEEVRADERVAEAYLGATYATSEVAG